MVDFKKFTKISEIKNAQENGKYVFSEDERNLYFTSHLIGKVDDAREVAELLVEIKDANSKRQKNPALVAKLENEKEKGFRGSVVYRVLNIENLVRNTIDRLVLLGRSDLPTDKDKINAEIAQLEKEIEEKRIERATNNRALEPLEREVQGLTKEKYESEKSLKRLSSISSILSGESDPEITYRGQTKIKLSSIPVSVKDYNGSNLWNPNPPTENASADVILAKCERYLTAIIDPGSVIFHKYHPAENLSA